jgi:ribosomal protein L32
VFGKKENKNMNKRQPKKWWISVCASCEHVYLGYKSCPKCGFAYYCASWVYGSLKALLYLVTQKPYWRKQS